MALHSFGRVVVPGAVSPREPQDQGALLEAPRRPPLSAGPEAPRFPTAAPAGKGNAAGSMAVAAQ